MSGISARVLVPPPAEAASFRPLAPAPRRACGRRRARRAHTRAGERAAASTRKNSAEMTSGASERQNGSRSLSPRCRHALGSDCAKSAEDTKRAVVLLRFSLQRGPGWDAQGREAKRDLHTRSHQKGESFFFSFSSPRSLLFPVLCFRPSASPCARHYRTARACAYVCRLCRSSVAPAQLHRPPPSEVGERKRERECHSSWYHSVVFVLTFSAPMGGRGSAGHAGRALCRGRRLCRRVGGRVHAAGHGRDGAAGVVVCVGVLQRLLQIVRRVHEQRKLPPPQLQLRGARAVVGAGVGAGRGRGTDLEDSERAAKWDNRATRRIEARSN